MKQKIIKKLSNGEIVDLSKLRKKDLKRLHYEEEKFVAEKLLKMKPFSHNRTQFMQQGYDLVNAIMPWYLPQVKYSFGANMSTVRLVCDIIESSGEKKLLYEAGVGTGFSCEQFVKLPNVRIKGCDILISEKVKRLMSENDNLLVSEEDLYSSLKKLEDKSIDYFYADNVFEHLLPDEYSQILKLLARKMKKGGILILIIPNRLIGPGDVSKYFVKQGKPAEGFHFTEMAYREVLKKFKKYGIVPKYFIWRDKSYNIRYSKDRMGILNFIKIFAEWLLSFCVKDWGLKMKLFHKLALEVYVLVKE